MSAVDRTGGEGRRGHSGTVIVYGYAEVLIDEYSLPHEEMTDSGAHLTTGSGLFPHENMGAIPIFSKMLGP